MKKVLLCAIALMFCAFTLSAQTVKEETVTFDKVQAPAFTMEIPDMSIDLITGALQKQFETKNNLKASKTKGYVAYLGQKYLPYGDFNFDIFTKVEEVGKKGAKTPKITILVSRGNNNFISSANDIDIATNVKRDLEAFKVYLKEYEVNQRLIMKNNELQKLQKNKEDLNKELTKLQKQVEDTQKKIADNEKQIQATQAEIDKANYELQLFH